MIFRVAKLSDPRKGPWEISHGYKPPFPTSVQRHVEPIEDAKLEKFYYEKIILPRQKLHKNRKKLVFGFESVDQFHFWFYKKEWRQELHRKGFVLHTFLEYGEEDEDYKFGESQVIFTLHPKGPIAKRSLI